MELARSLSFFRSFFLSFFSSLSLSFFFLSLSLTLSFLWHISLEQCHMFEGLFSNNLSDNHLLKGHECKIKGTCMQMKGR